MKTGKSIFMEWLIECKKMSSLNNSCIGKSPVNILAFAYIYYPGPHATVSAITLVTSRPSIATPISSKSHHFQHRRHQFTVRPKHANLSHNMELESSPVRGILAWQIAQVSYDDTVTYLRVHLKKQQQIKFNGWYHEKITQNNSTSNSYSNSPGNTGTAYANSSLRQHRGWWNNRIHYESSTQRGTLNLG